MSVPGRTKQKSTWVVVPPKTIPRVSSSGPSVWRLSSGCIEMKWARCVWGSIPPGTTSFPVASSTRPASTRGSGRPTATMRSPWTATSHRPTPCGVTTSPPRITRSSMVLPPSLHLGRGLPSDEPRVDLLEELRVEDTLGGDLLGDPVERVEEVDELAHAAVDLVGHLHRVDVEGHDVAREPFVHLHLTRHDLHGGLAVGVDRGRRLRERAQHRLQGVRVLLEHLAARDDPRVHEEPVDLTLLARDVAQRVGHGELRRHLRVPHEPRIHLAELRPLRERTARLPEDEKRRQHHRQLSHPTAPFGMSGPRQGSARPRSTRRSVISSRALTSHPRAPSSRAPMTIWAGLKKTRPSMIRLPRPASAPMNSAPTITKIASPKPRRSATTMPGSAAGSTTRRRRSRREAPRLAAARSNMTSTRRRLAPVPTNIGKNVVYAMKATFDVSPRPNHTRNIGRKASGGIGRTNSMTGSSASRAGVETATSRPRASAAAAASPNPSTMRRADTARRWASDPSRVCTAASAPTSPGVGSSTGFMTSSARLP